MKYKFVKQIVVIALILAGSNAAFAQEDKKEKPRAGVVFATQKQLQKDVDKVPCENKNRLEGVRKLFIEKGARVADIKIEDFGHVKNLVLEKPGKSKETVIVGAHYDETGGGCGAIDNWTGIVIIANIYHTLKDLTTEKTYKFVAFGREEQGLVGSKAMARAIPKEERASYCAMVNLDSFGFTYPQAMRNVSSTKLLKLSKNLAEQLKMPHGQAAIQFASSDSASFQNVKIPAISFHGLTGRWSNFLHTSRDKVKNVNITSVYYGYRFSVSFLAAIENSPCDAFRKKKKAAIKRKPQ